MVSDVALLAEVGDSTYPENSGEFLREYAARGIPVYWVVNVAGRRVEVYSDPHRAEDGTGVYRSRVVYALDQSIPIDVTHEGAAVRGEVAVMDILRDSI